MLLFLGFLLCEWFVSHLLHTERSKDSNIYKHPSNPTNIY